MTFDMVLDIEQAAYNILIKYIYIFKQFMFSVIDLM